MAKSYRKFYTRQAQRDLCRAADIVRTDLVTPQGDIMTSKDKLDALIERGIVNPVTVGDWTLKGVVTASNFAGAVPLYLPQVKLSVIRHKRQSRFTRNFNRAASALEGLTPLQFDRELKRYFNFKENELPGITTDFLEEMDAVGEFILDYRSTHGHSWLKTQMDVCGSLQGVRNKNSAWETDEQIVSTIHSDNWSDTYRCVLAFEGRIRPGAPEEANAYKDRLHTFFVLNDFDEETVARRVYRRTIDELLDDKSDRGGILVDLFNPDPNLPDWEAAGKILIGSTRKGDIGCFKTMNANHIGTGAIPHTVQNLPKDLARSHIYRASLQYFGDRMDVEGLQELAL